MIKHKLEYYFAFVAVILSAVFLRLIPHPPNLAPIAALALFSGATVPNWKGFIIPLIALFISDLFLGFHTTIPYVYVSFLLIAGMGYLIREKKSSLSIGISSIVGSVLFFFITNTGVWITSSSYEKSINGLILCYTMGLPFFRNTLMGDVLFTSIFFLGYRYLKLLFVLMMPSASGRERHVGNTV